MRIFGLIVTVLFFVLPLGPAQASLDAVLARLEKLEQENAALKRRVAALEGRAVAATAAPAPAAVIASPAHEADETLYAASLAAETAPRWSRTYIGLQGGITRGEPEYPFLGDEFGGDTFSGELRGESFGAQIGQTWQSGPFVVGVELQARNEDVTSEARAISDYTFTANDDFYEYRAVGVGTAEVPWSAAAKGRAGLATDTAFVYATAGVTAAKLDESYESLTLETITAIGPGGTGDGSTLVIHGALEETSSIQIGLIAGFGFEYALTRNLSIGAEYEYTRLGERSFSPAGADTVFDWHTATARLNVSF